LFPNNNLAAKQKYCLSKKILATKHWHPSTKQPEIVGKVFGILFFSCQARCLEQGGGAEVGRWRDSGPGATEKAEAYALTCKVQFTATFGTSTDKLS
jgi:hypothetical protein